MGSFITNASEVEGELGNLATTIFDEPTIRKIVYSYLHAPYMWGGMTHLGIDCSGFSQILYRFFNIPLSHIASDQMLAGTVLDFLANANIGDLAFFENEEKEINHVGILLSPTEIIHASETNGKVAIDSIDMHGIINRMSGKRTHTLRLIKRLITITK
jgi:cell wall-associated NlpC family hydrolase